MISTTSISFNATSPGVGDFVVASAFTACVTPEQSNVKNGNIYAYYAQSADGSVWESGSGTYTVATHTLARTTISANSNGDLATVAFAAPPIVSLFPSAAGLLESAFTFGSGSLTATAPVNIGSLSETAGIAWSSYTPTLSAATGTFTTASAVGRFRRLGKTIFVSVTITITTNGTAAGNINATLPLTASGSGNIVVCGRENAIGGKMLQGLIAAGSGSMAIFNYDNTYPGGTGTVLIMSGTYEAA